LVLVFDTDELVVQSRRAEKSQGSSTAVKVGDKICVKMHPERL